MRRRGIGRCWALASIGLLYSTGALAQAEPAPTEGTEPPAPQDVEPAAALTETPPPASSSDTEAKSVEIATAPTPPPAPANGPTAEQFAAMEARLAAMEAAQEEAKIAAMTSEEEESTREDVLKIYGFMDMGIQRTWVDESTIIAAFFDTNALTFATGNIDLYFDANPHPDWRALAEIRFSNAPRGRINNFGGIAGTFEREDTQLYDPGGTVVNSPMWTGSVVIERAWVEWNRFQSFQLRTGNFFTPFGIWNVDHGSPTLISAMLPQFIQQFMIPLRQTGVQALGSFFPGDFEVAYRAWVTNGREEINTLDFTDDKAVGARLILRKGSGKVQGELGSSYHHGRVTDRVVDIESAPPITPEIRFNSYESFAYVEDAIGVDISIDVGRTRIRSEGLAHLTRYEDGKREDSEVTSPVPGSQTPDSWKYSVYALVAHQLPWAGLEPYMYAELTQQNFELPDGMVNLAPGFNIRFNPAAQLKVQVSRAILFDWLKETPGDASIHNTTSFVGRIVVAF